MFFTYDISIITPLGKFNEPTEPPAADWLAKLHSSMIHSYYYYYYNAWFPPLPLHENRWIDDDVFTVQYFSWLVGVVQPQNDVV